MTEKEFKKPPSLESTISRQTRNAFLVAIIFTVAALVNLTISIRVAFTTQTLLSFADSLIVFTFIIITISSARMIHRGKKDQGIKFLLGSFIVTLALRNALTAGLGTVFGILAATLVSFIALLTLHPKEFNRAIIVGIISGAFLQAFDLLAPAYRQSAATAETMIRSITVIASLITIAYIIIIFKQHRQLLLSAKLTLGIIFVVLVPIVVLSIVGSISLDGSLRDRQNDALQGRAALVAKTIDNFLQANVDALRVEGQSPVLANYLAMIAQPGDTSPYASMDTNDLNQYKADLAKQALESLQSFRRKDLVYIESYAILDTSGKNLLDTNVNSQGNDESDEEYFKQPLENKAIFISNIRTDTTRGIKTFYFSSPIRTEYGKTIGILRVEYNASILQTLIDQYSKVATEGSFAAILAEIDVAQENETDPDSVYIFLAHGKNPDLALTSATQLTTSIITPLQMDHILPRGSTAQLTIDVPGLDEGLRNSDNAPVFEAHSRPKEENEGEAYDIIGVAQLTTTPWVVIVSEELSIFNSPFDQQNKAVRLSAILIATVAVIAGAFGGQWLTAPILRLTDTTTQIAQGDLSARATVDTEDEIGMLGQAFNSMAAQLDDLIDSLEERVATRTHDLDRRATQLQAAAEVGHAAASLRDLDELLTQATHLISNRFGFYHAGIFLLDERGEYAVLRAANSDGGQRMLTRKHRLKVGEVGLVGYATGTGEARIALDVGQDAVFFDNPDMPNTRSEMALPLIAGGKILGALDVQSEEGEAFQQADIVTLQVLADQIAVAIENARLFAENQATLDSVRRAYGEQSRTGWKELLSGKKRYAYRGTSAGEISLVTDESDADFQQAIHSNESILNDDNKTVDIPVSVRGQAIGTIRLSKPKNANAWTEDELELAQTLAEGLSGAVDGARLFGETRQRAEQERIVSEITSHMQETMDVETVIRTAADEIYGALDLERITIRLANEDKYDEEEEIA